MIDQANFGYYLPSDTAALLTPDRIKRCKNLGLILDKYPQRRATEKGDLRSQWLREVEPASHIDPALGENVYQRWLAMTTAMQAQHFSAAIDWRMVIGLGGETVLETDLTLHYVYGIPYIPGSAQKGLTRSYVTSEVEGYKSVKIENDNEEIKRIFGSQERAGTVIFFDAMPISGKAAFALDIMNPHYPDYYAGSKAPTNDQAPVPITFLTVSDTAFMFALAPRDSNDKHKADVELVKKWLQEALQNYGIGGKTSAGYGYLIPPHEHTRPNLPQFHKGDTLRGVVIDEKNDQVAARYISSGQASKCLQYQAFPSDQVLILIDPQYEEAKQWKVRNVSICQFIEERVEDHRTLLICEPKKKDK
jgi:CRISPR-associated protein Cmr6